MLHCIVSMPFLCTAFHQFYSGNVNLFQCLQVVECFLEVNSINSTDIPYSSTLLITDWIIVFITENTYSNPSVVYFERQNTHHGLLPQLPDTISCLFNNIQLFTLMSYSLFQCCELHNFQCFLHFVLISEVHCLRVWICISFPWLMYSSNNFSLVMIVHSVKVRISCIQMSSNIVQLSIFKYLVSHRYKY